MLSISNQWQFCICHFTSGHRLDGVEEDTLDMLFSPFKVCSTLQIVKGLTMENIIIYRKSNITKNKCSITCKILSIKLNLVSFLNQLIYYTIFIYLWQIPYLFEATLFTIKVILLFILNNVFSAVSQFNYVFIYLNIEAVALYKIKK
jgi:hypothetical protein